MNLECITTKSGKTVLSSNQKLSFTNAIPVLYLHGGPGSPALNIVDFLNYKGLVYTYAQFGSGGSEEKKEYTSELFVQQLREIIDNKFENMDIILYGTSWGATLALLYIEKYGTEHISKLVLSSPLINADDNNRANRKRIEKLPDYIKDTINKYDKMKFYGESYSLANRAFFRDYFHGYVTEEMADFCFEPSKEVYLQMYGNDEGKCSGNMKNINLEKTLSSIDIPVLYTSGDRDLHSVEDVKKYCSKNKNVKLHIMKNSGHANLHPDYKRIIKNFIQCVVENPTTEKDDSFSEQEDYDMILSDSPHDTPQHLIYAAKKMSIEECEEEARRYETGDGRPQSYLSAEIFYRECSNKTIERWEIPAKAFEMRCNAKDANRRCIISRRGIESFCCEDMANHKGPSISFNTLSLSLKGFGKIHSCPFCGKEIEFLLPDKDLIKIDNDEEYDKLRNEYLNVPHTVEKAISLFDALNDYYRHRNFDEKYSKKSTEMRKILDKIYDEKIMNVTGKLTASSAGLESICCTKLRDNLDLISYMVNHYQMRVHLKDSNDKHERIDLKICPYCGKRKKRIPRTY